MRTLGKDIQTQDVIEDSHQFELRINDICSRMQELRDSQDEYIQFCENKGFAFDTTGVDISGSIQQIMDRIIREFRSDEPESVDWKCYSRYVTRQNLRIRHLLLLLRQFCNHIEWSSGSYSQSVAPHFFDVRKQTGQIVNYDRWSSFMINDLENQLAHELYLLNDDWSLLLASSGMAAYSIIHHYISQILSVGDEVLIPIPVYHESETMVSSLKGIQVTHLGTTDIDQIIESITPQTRVLFLTPITNDEALRFLDVEALLKRLELLALDLYIVFDGTMVGGLIRPETCISPKGSVKLLYFESGNKYQQFEDTGMKGIVIIPQYLKSELSLIRQELGAILYDQIASALPQRLSRKEMTSRMIRFSRNALILSDRVNSDPLLKHFCVVNYPLSPSHPDFEAARQYSLEQLGGVVMFSFKSAALHNIGTLNHFIEQLIDQCQKHELPFCTGDSYGFSIPRLHVGGSKTNRPFLRLCVGNRSINELQAFTDCLVTCLHEQHKLLS